MAELEYVSPKELEGIISPIKGEIDKIRQEIYRMGKCGLYFPLYAGLWNDSGRAVWDAVIKAKLDHPNVNFVVSVNPNNGSGTSINTLFRDYIKRLKDAGVDEILGYIPSYYGKATDSPPVASPFTNVVYTLDVIRRNIDNYKNWYPQVTGFMIDEVSNAPEKVSFYKAIADYSKANGFTYLKGNCGTRPLPALIDIFDNISVSEGKGMLTEEQLRNATLYSVPPAYIKRKFSVTRWGVPTFDIKGIRTTSAYVGLMYLTNDADGNQYDTKPAYFDDLLEILEIL